VPKVNYPASSHVSHILAMVNACIDKDADGNAVFKSGIMSVVLTSGDVKAGNAISIELLGELYQPLEIV
jgi:hypothetical protein